MATPKINENCHYMQNDPHKCKIKLEKFHFDILCHFWSYYGKSPRGRNPPPQIRLNRATRPMNFLQIRGSKPEILFLL